MRATEIKELYQNVRDRTATQLFNRSREINSQEEVADEVRHTVLDGFNRFGVPIASIGQMPFLSFLQRRIDGRTPRIRELLLHARPHAPPQEAVETELELIDLPSERAQQVAGAVFTKLQDLRDTHTLRIDLSTFGFDPQLPEDELLLRDFLESQIRLQDSFKHLDIEVVGLKLAQVDDLRRLSNSVRNETVRTRAENTDLDQRMRFRPTYLTPHPTVTVIGDVPKGHNLATTFDPTQSHGGTRTVKFRGAGPDTIQPSSIVLLGAALITEERVDALERIGEHHFILGSDLAFAREVAFALDLLLRQAEATKELHHAA